MPAFTENELESIFSKNDRNNALLKRLWEKKQADVRGFRDRVYNTGSKDVYAFKNLHMDAPVHVLVCPTKPYMTFSHFVEEASSQEIGDFFKAVLRAGQAATDEHERKIAENPQLKQKRDYYENEFDKYRNLKKTRTLTSDETKALHDVVKSYLRDSVDMGFVVRDPRTGRSGMRIAINESPTTAGNSQQHFHVHVLSGKYLGAPVTQDTLKTYGIKGAVIPLSDTITR